MRTGWSRSWTASSPASSLPAPRRARGKDFTTADAIRDRLAGAGVELVDSASGTRWTLTEDGA